MIDVISLIPVMVSGVVCKILFITIYAAGQKATEWRVL